jgi:2-dehydro-3-deoxygalactonokinase
MITIDSGTTNTRIYLVDGSDYRIIDNIKKNVGVRNTAIHGSSDELKQALSLGIQEIMARNHCEPRDIKFISAAGMITSNLGLVQVPYVNAPCTKAELSAGSIVLNLPEFHNIPCVFIPGMKNMDDSLDDLDVMRGEEVETLGLLRQLDLSSKGLLILPGSHTKFVMTVDENIIACRSTLSGEMLHAIQKNTILSDSISKDLIEAVDHESLIQGFHCGRRNGLSRALYQVRLLQLFGVMNRNQRANFYVGAVLASDIATFQTLYMEMQPEWILVGGSNPLRGAFACLLNELHYPNVFEANEEQVMKSTIIGSLEVGNMRMSHV